jgi:hypothetical protein
MSARIRLAMCRIKKVIGPYYHFLGVYSRIGNQEARADARPFMPKKVWIEGFDRLTYFWGIVYSLIVNPL